jgi:hypothetical protein
MWLALERIQINIFPFTGAVELCSVKKKKKEEAEEEEEEEEEEAL